MSFLGYCLTVFGMILVIEGLLYGLFPEFMRRMLAMALLMPLQQLRTAGLVSAGAGFLLIFLIWQTGSF